MPRRTRRNEAETHRVQNGTIATLPGVRDVRVPVLVVLAFLPAAALAEPGEGDCRRESFTAGEPLEAALVRNEGTRLPFVKNAADQEGCPAAAETCRERAYLVPGNGVIAGRSHQGFRCAIYIASNGQARAGWLPAAGLITLPAAHDPDFAGKWRAGPEQSMDIRRDGGDWRLDGQATYGAQDPERLRRGAVNIGEVSATVPRAGVDGPTRLAFTVGDDGTLPYDKGDESACRMRMQLVGPWLVVTDNLRCGGANVTFTGIYRRTP